MFFYLYKITNKVNGKIYVGVHKTKNMNDGYMGSGKVIRDALKKYGENNFEKEILEFFENEEHMFLREKEFVNDDFLVRKDVYNLRCGGYGGFDHIHKLNLHRGFKGKHHSIETKKRMSESNSGKKHSNETKKRMSENNWSKSNPEAQRKHAILAAKKSHGSRGRVISIKTKEKTSQSLKKYWEQDFNFICPPCKKQGRGHVMKRWHFDKCKMAN